MYRFQHSTKCDTYAWYRCRLYFDKTKCCPSRARVHKASDQLDQLHHLHNHAGDKYFIMAREIEDEKIKVAIEASNPTPQHVGATSTAAMVRKDKDGIRFLSKEGSFKARLQRHIQAEKPMPRVPDDYESFYETFPDHLKETGG